MRIYSIAKVESDMGFALKLAHSSLTEVRARNYDEAVEKGTKKLHLKKGDMLSILALTGNRPHGMGRYTYEV